MLIHLMSLLAPGTKGRENFTPLKSGQYRSSYSTDQPPVSFLMSILGLSPSNFLKARELYFELQLPSLHVAPLQSAVAS